MRIAISGAGVAGAALAHWLHRTGHIPTLIEQAPRFRTAGYMIDFWGVGYRVAQRMGVETQILEAGYEVQCVRSVGPNGEIKADLGVDGFRRMIGDDFTSLPRGDLAATIYATIENEVEIVLGDSIAALDEHGDSVHVAFEHAQPRDFDLVIGADGLHSGTRRLVFGPEEQYVTQLGQCFGFFDIENRLRLDHCGMACIDAGRTAALQGIYPDKPARASLFLTDRHLDFDYRDTDGNKRLFAERYAGMGWEVPNMLEGLGEAAEVYFDSIAQVHLPSYSRGRVCLTGDAAWCASPRSGMGTTLAMVGAYVLAHELRTAGDDYAAAFAQYQRLLAPYVARCQKLAIDALRTERFSSGRLAKLRNVVIRLVRIPGVSKLVARQSLAVARSLRLPNY
jgi:2-polyprenyl-6-methoxyphenol hydroxylase-like FAD-dependent oxidoreductase